MSERSSISVLISKLAQTGDKTIVGTIKAQFPEAVFGVLLHGLPKAEHGTKLVVDHSKPVTMQFVHDPHGRKMIKACADPEIFNRNYPGNINATMTGRELLDMAEKISVVEGILICSALSSHSFPIPRNTFLEIKTH